ncbi:phosphorylase kinase [Hahella sp. CCB-MM4]|uniref:glycoside hydrolase family 15 protein n=1 Tax=Hahella sp. (strain CCB-MM4) TaxID=1926491 RepID=UPI000B9B8833|nr:glycoside hydrolase family 15 protein [Hahella sp. CCB-MM4]OZG72350.1 phosphorylase kinase [Hahella sp. CCB-MM4]
MKQTAFLDQLYSEVNTVILSRQHPVTGLLPASTSVNTHGDYTDAWVRDNVYSIICVWGLSLAYRHEGDHIRSDQLEQACIKLMRGLLQAMMRQSAKVEYFKITQDRLDSLHAKYDTSTGLEVVADDAWGHLQIDATSVFMLMLAQMTASGLRIVCTLSEVDFVQNLVYYVSTAYRVADYGIWERGNKINNGKTEINASSVGMAKAALQALDGLNLFGKGADPKAVIHTIPDAVSRARSTLAALLPRESLSKEVDSALLSIIGYPAFAVGDQEVIRKTRQEILTKLEGRYGCKRFLWDGHQTELEDSSRIHYEHSELANFEHVESEWPLFFTYLYLSALFDGDTETAAHYRARLEALTVEVDGQKLLPELYLVPKDKIAAEKRHPHSQERLPNENIPLVWAQSLYLTGLMLDEGLISEDDLDPLRMRRRATRYINAEVALVVLAENDEVKRQLSDHGVIAETLEDIRPIAVVSATHLVEAYTRVGANDALGLTGRPRRRLQSLATSQTYRINEQMVLCLSWLQSEYGDYRKFDARLVIEKVKREIRHIRQHWYHNEVAVFTLMIDQMTCMVPDAGKLFLALRDMQLRSEHEQVGYASASLAFRASRVNSLTIPEVCIAPLVPRSHPHLIDTCKLDAKVFTGEAEILIHRLINSHNERENLKAIKAFFDVGTDKSGAKHSLEEKAEAVEKTVESEPDHLQKELLSKLYLNAQYRQHWSVARFCFGMLNYSHVGLADSLTNLNSRHMSVTIGQKAPVNLSAVSPLADEAVSQEIARHVKDPLERVLYQELLVTLGSLLRTESELFEGLRTLQLRNLVLVCAELKDDSTLEIKKALVELAGLSPSALYHRVRNILSAQKEHFSYGVRHSFKVDAGGHADIYEGVMLPISAVGTDWLEWRIARGMLTGFDSTFLKSIWKSLAHAKSLIFGEQASPDSILECDIVRGSMTPGEESFARLIDQLLQPLHPAYYKSTVIEALYAFAEYCTDHPTRRFEEPINLSLLIESAAELYVVEEAMEQSEERNLDLLMQLPPHLTHIYFKKALAGLGQVEMETTEAG